MTNQGRWHIFYAAFFLFLEGLGWLQYSMLGLGLRRYVEWKKVEKLCSVEVTLPV